MSENMAILKTYINEEQKTKGMVKLSICFLAILDVKFRHDSLQVFVYE